LRNLVNAQQNVKCAQNDHRIHICRPDSPGIRAFRVLQETYMNGDSMRPDSVLDRMRRACIGAFSALMTYSLCINLLMLTSSIYMMQVFDRVLVSRSGETLVMLSVIAIIALSTMAGLDIIRTRIMHKVGAWLDDQISPVVLGMSITVALGREGRKSPEKLRDLSEIKAFLSGPSAIPILDAPWVPVFLGFMFMLHPVLGWVAVSGAVVLLALAILNDWI
jgi:ABC-type protease/lipase transport system fused ATPase/permease subunit